MASDIHSIYSGLNGHVLTFYRLPTYTVPLQDKWESEISSVSFMATLKSWDDDFKVEWEGHEAYGRMDRIQGYKRTGRNMSISWAVVASDKKMARSNLGKISQLLNMIYPTYDSSGPSANIIVEPPLLRVKFGNLIQREDGGALLVAIQNVKHNIKPDNEGMFTGGSGVFYPMTSYLQSSFEILHEHPLGWTKGNYLRKPMSKFPYGLLGSDVSVAAGGQINESANAGIRFLGDNAAAFTTTVAGTATVANGSGGEIPMGFAAATAVGAGELTRNSQTGEIKQAPACGDKPIDEKIQNDSIGGMILGVPEAEGSKEETESAINGEHNRAILID